MMQRAAAFAGESGWAPAFPPSRGAGRATDSTRRPRGLVIEDEDRVRDVVCEMLHVIGWEATAAASGIEGLARVELNAYDLVLTDLAMPGLSGWEVVAAVRQRAPVAGVIVMAATTTARDAARARELGLGLLQKPFGLRALATALGRSLALDDRFR